MTNPFDEINSKLDRLEKLLQYFRNLNNQPAAASDDQIFNIEDAAEFLHLAIPTIYGLVHRSQIPNMKKGKRLYFSKQELTEWLKKGRRKTAVDFAEEAEKHLLKKRKGGKR